jgi:signal transduction histidine kinase
MATNPDSVQPSAELAKHLLNRRDAILNKWRTVCEQDPTLSHVASLTREEFNNMLPITLNILGQRLQAQSEEADATTVASAHGLHRWHHGQPLRNVLTELNHLYRLLFDELTLYQQLNPQTDLAVLLAASGQLAQLKSETIEGSATEYEAQQRLAATSRSAGLQQALTQLNQLSRERGDLLRASSHDLNGSFATIQGAAFLLNQEGKTEEDRTRLANMLNQNLTGVRNMLRQLTDLARLEAGQESLDIQPFDAAVLLRELVAIAQPLAIQKGLTFQTDGPDTLPVKGDAVKIQRIVQNLLLNAVKYTPTGLISVSWSSEGNYRWYVSIQDSGPGLPENSMGMLLGQRLYPVTEPSAVLKRDSTTDYVAAPSADPGPFVPEVAGDQPIRNGEGIGLHIVKQLCELMGANIDVETGSGNGTLFRVRFLIEQVR